VVSVSDAVVMPDTVETAGTGGLEDSRRSTLVRVSRAPEPVERDSRGILDPWLLRERVRLTRYPPTTGLDGLVDRFWAVTWDLPPGVRHRQQVLTHPVANISVGTETGSLEARLHGVARDLTERTLEGRGWTVAAMTTPGGLGALIPGPASDLTDRSVDLGVGPGALCGLDLDAARLARRVAAASDEPARVAVLAQVLERAVDRGRAPGALEVAALARVAETHRSVRRLDELCERAGLGRRAVQRMFLQYAGVSPTWVLRRYRLLDAAEAVRDGERVVWSEVASDLGYADQAHLVRDFRAALGRTPAAYAEAIREGRVSAGEGPAPSASTAPGADPSHGPGDRTRR